MTLHRILCCSRGVADACFCAGTRAVVVVGSGVVAAVATAINIMSKR